MNDKNNLANVGVDVMLDIKPTAAIYLVAVILLGSVAFFAAKKYIR